MTFAQVVTEQPWRKEAACRGMDADLFFPKIAWPTHGSRPGHGHGPNVDAQIAAAKAVCAICPVREACLEHALETREPEGIWGMLDPRERYNLRRRRRSA